MKWETVRLGDYVKFRSGGTPSKSNPGFWSGDIPWVSSGEMDQSRIYDTKLHVTEEAVEAGSRMVSAGAILAVVRGMSLAKDFRVARVMRDVAFNQDLKAIEPDATLDSNFLYWMLSSKRNFIRDHATEASHGTKKLELDVLESLVVPRPPLPTQRRIAEILSAYDDLIENNQRRMKLLEESARLLYEEWFVRLRFPGHEHTKIVDGVPEGWARSALSELSESIDYGYTASAEKEPVGPRFLRITDIVPDVLDWSSVPYCQIESGKRDRFLLSEGDIVIARTGATVGYAKRIHRRHEESVFASYLVRLKIRQEYDNLMIGIFAESSEYKKFVMSRINGAAQPNANAKVLSSAIILMPTAAIQSRFREKVEPMVDQRELLQAQNQKLRAARDLLLPRLMNGEIEV